MSSEPTLPAHGPDHVVIPGDLAHALWEWSQASDIEYWSGENLPVGELVYILKRWEIEHARI